MSPSMDIARDPASKARLLVRHAGPVPSAARVRVDQGEAAVLVRNGRLVALLKVGVTQVGAALLGPDAPPAPPGSPLDCELWYVSTLPTGHIPVLGSAEVFEGGIPVRFIFSGTCGMSCTDPPKLVTKLLQTGLPLGDAFERELLGRHVVDALRSTIQASLDAGSMTVLYLREDEPSKLVLDYALMAGRQFLGGFGLTFLGFDAGRFELPRDVDAALRAGPPPPPAEALRITGHELTVQQSEVTPVRLHTERRRQVDPLAMTPGSGMPAMPSLEGPPSSGPASEPASQPSLAAASGAGSGRLASTPYPLSRENARKAPVVVRSGLAGTAVAVVQESPFPVGSRVRAQASDGQWYPGTVVRCHVGVHGEVEKVEVAFADGGANEVLDLRRVTHG